VAMGPAANTGQVLIGEAVAGCAKAGRRCG
jgi:hypothetical protein